MGIFYYIYGLCLVGDSGKYYCGLRRLTCHCCSGICEPNGCNCPACAQLDAEDKASTENGRARCQNSQQIINSWTWKRSIGKVSQLVHKVYIYKLVCNLVATITECTLHVTYIY